jgi:hypothetical protein
VIGTLRSPARKNPSPAGSVALDLADARKLGQQDRGFGGSHPDSREIRFFVQQGISKCGVHGVFRLGSNEKLLSAFGSFLTPAKGSLLETTTPSDSSQHIFAGIIAVAGDLIFAGIRG